MIVYLLKFYCAAMPPIVKFIAGQMTRRDWAAFYITPVVPVTFAWDTMPRVSKVKVEILVSNASVAAKLCL